MYKQSLPVYNRINAHRCENTHVYCLLERKNILESRVKCIKFQFSLDTPVVLINLLVDHIYTSSQSPW